MSTRANPAVVDALTRVVFRPEEEEPRQRPLDFALFARLFQYARPYRKWQTWLIVLTVLRSVQLPLLGWLLGAVISGPIARGDWAGTIWGAVGFLALAAFTQITFHYRYLLALKFGEAIVHDIRREIFQHLMRLPLGFYHRTKVGRIISRVTSDVDAMRVGVQDALFVLIVGVGQMIGAAALMFWADVALASVVMAMAPILWMINRYFHRRFSRVTRNLQESWSRVTATMAESVTGIRVTQGFVRQDVNAGIFRRLIADHSRHNFEMARTGGLLAPLLELNNQFFIASLLLLGGYRVLNPEIHMPLGEMIQFFFLANIFFQPIQGLGNLYNSCLLAMAGAERVFRLLDTPPEWSDPRDARPAPPLRGRIEFDHVTFAYEPGRPVLHDISFVVEPGQTVALVGHTGSGKSSIVNLIAKFYLPTAGRVLLDDLDIRQLTTDSLHRQLGIVPQQNFLFYGTVMENIRIGRPDATDAEIIEAARQLDCLDLIEALPQGFDTPVGERGASLSLGQRQLICFLRALIANPRILILDEATSSVDTLTETRLQRALAKLLHGRTSVVVAHRLSTIRHADLVLVLESGRIVERGNHETLFARGGVYAELYRQFTRATTVASVR
ncbi:MAG: ABC transporter ATP-binding protein/permease [Verrucomicrobiae bacterium]|nr:ABC transporter ATP-binding protein/permease [Verrucomicrobiae bacterium]MDW8344510.1 ABC transporter ATP-binding protein [Verrucomicrobiae bacterium]